MRGDLLSRYLLRRDLDIPGPSDKTPKKHGVGPKNLAQGLWFCYNAPLLSLFLQQKVPNER